MGLRSFIDNVLRVFKVTRKPSRSEYWLLLRICILGLTAIGIYGFIILYLATVITGVMGL